MGAGPNYVLDKGLLATGTALYQYGQPVTFGTPAQSCAPISVANTYVLGVCQENIDAARVTTGKAIINVRMMGIARALVGAAVAKGDPLTVDATGRFIPQVSAGGKFFAVAMEAQATVGGLVEVTLIDGYATI
jgi:hypothetical protein